MKSKKRIRFAKLLPVWLTALLVVCTVAGCGTGPVLSASDKDAIEALERYRTKYQLDNEGHVIDLQLDGRRVEAGALDAVCKLSELRRLSLYAASLTDESLEKLAGLAQLESLGLGATPVTDGGLTHLEKLPSLHWLWLPKSTKVTDQRVEDLKRRLPGLVVYRQG